MSASRVVTVEIQGQRYPVRSDLDPDYVAQLAQYVDSKMTIAARESSAADSMRIAVIAALNLADEVFRAREEGAGGQGLILSRAAELERIVDAVLAKARETSDLPQARVV